MDPLSLTASIITVVGMGSAVGRGLKKILSAKNLPDVILQLNNEVVDLEYVIQDVHELLQQQAQSTFEDPGPPSSHKSLSCALERAKRTLLALESLIAYELTIVDSRNGETKIDWLSWLRAESKVKRLKEDVRTDRVRLSSGLSLLVSSNSLRLHDQLRRISLQTEPLELQISRASGAIMDRIEEVESHVHDTFERQSGQEPSIKSLPKHKASRSSKGDCDSYQTSPSQIEVDSHATMWTPTKSQTSELDSGAIAYHTMLRPTESPTSQPDLSDNTYATTTFELNRNSCELSCSCTCHKTSRFRSPTFMATIVGSLFLGYNAVPWFSRGCDSAFCRSHSSKLTYTYAFPRWFVDRVISLKISNTKLGGPELCLRLARMRPSDSDVFIAAMDGSDEVATHHIRRLLLAGEASVLDVTPDGETALQTAIRHRNFKATELLIKAGSDVFYEDFQGLSPYFKAWEMILSSRDSAQSLVCDHLSNLIGGRSHLISFDFPKLLSAYLGVSGRTFGSVLAQTPRSSIDLVDASGRTTLSWAAGKGDHDAVKNLLRCGADPSHADKDGWTPLHWSAFADNHESVRSLLAAKADVNAKGRRRNTALCTALNSLETDDPDSVEILISHDADIESIGENGWTPLHLAAWSDKAKCLSLVFRSVTKARSSPGYNALQTGIMHNCHQAVKTLLDHGGSDYDNKDVLGHIELHIAALFGDLDTIAILRSANLSKVDLTAPFGDGGSALHWAEWRYKYNENWSNWKIGPMDEGPLRWFSAFKALWDDIVERQGNAYSGENSADKEWEDEEQGDEEREDWQDAPESADASSVIQEEQTLGGARSLIH